MALRDEPFNVEPQIVGPEDWQYSSDDLHERMTKWVREAFVKCEVANFEWEFHQATALCDRYGCMEFASGPFCPRCGR